MDLKTDGTGQVLFPFRDKDGHVWAVRALNADGQTCDIGNPAGRPDLSHVIDPAGHLEAGKPYAGPVLLTTDVLAAATIHMKTETPVVVVGKDADLPTRARALRAQYPGSSITVAATEKNQSVELATKVAGGEVVIISNNQILAQLIADQAGKGKAVPVGREVAEHMGAFVEDALSVQEAKASQPRKGKAPRKGPGIGR